MNSMQAKSREIKPILEDMAARDHRWLSEYFRETTLRIAGNSDDLVAAMVTHFCHQDPTGKKFKLLEKAYQEEKAKTPLTTYAPLTRSIYGVGR